MKAPSACQVGYASYYVALTHWIFEPSLRQVSQKYSIVSEINETGNESLSLAFNLRTKLGERMMTSRDT